MISSDEGQGFRRIAARIMELIIRRWYEFMGAGKAGPVQVSGFLKGRGKKAIDDKESVEEAIQGDRPRTRPPLPQGQRMKDCIPSYRNERQDQQLSRC